MRKRGRKPRIIVASCPFFCYFIVQVQNVSSPLHIFVVLSKSVKFSSLRRVSALSPLITESTVKTSRKRILPRF